MEDLPIKPAYHVETQTFSTWRCWSGPGFPRESWEGRWIRCEIDADNTGEMIMLSSRMVVYRYCSGRIAIPDAMKRHLN